jgi:hypothetical protein
MPHFHDDALETVQCSEELLPPNKVTPCTGDILGQVREFGHVPSLVTFIFHPTPLPLKWSCL